jgi:hypothetical protein
VREIPLTQGYVALVDDEDFEFLSQWKWRVLKAMDGRKIYARRSLARTTDGKRPQILMHTALMGTPDGLEVDHENGNGLDNQRHNLRVGTHQQNMRNRGPGPNTESGFKGVCRTTHGGRWQVTINIEGKNQYLGCFTDATDAARVYDTYAREYHGEFAQLNFPEED